MAMPVGSGSSGIEREWSTMKITSTRSVRTSALPEFQALASARAQALLEELDTWLSNHEAAGDKSGQGRYVSLGIYYFERENEGDNRS